LNYPKQTAGRGFCVVELLNGKKILITQVLGRVFLESLDCPVQALEELLSQYRLGGNVAAVFVDIHAEATAEKLSFGYCFDGRVSVVAGTHTHIPTADARILPSGTAYITDVGMCGDYNSVLGFEKEAPIARLRRQYPTDRLIPSKGEGSVWGIFVETDDISGMATHIKQFSYVPE
jgi:metallophosphoesterase (TIGR00282 family)